MRKLTSAVLVALLLLSAAPVYAQGGPIASLKQFLKVVAAGDDVAAWRSLTAASKTGIPRMAFEDIKKTDPNVSEADVAGLFTSENPKVLKVFFDALRSSLDLKKVLQIGKFSEGEYQGQKVVLVEGPPNAAYVMVDEGGWKVGLLETVKMSEQKGQ